MLRKLLTPDVLKTFDFGRDEEGGPVIIANMSASEISQLIIMERGRKVTLSLIRLLSLRDREAYARKIMRAHIGF